MKNKLFKTAKQMLSVTIAVAIIAVSLFAAIAGVDFTANAATVEDTWDGTLATSFESGSGTESDPYIIATAEQLAYAALGAPSVSEGKYFKVIDNATFNLNGMKDITLDSTVGDVMVSDVNKNWRPATDTSQSFAGFFDGNGVVIYNMCSSGYGYSGLFPRPFNNNSEKKAWVKNITLLNSRSIGYHNAGGIVGLYDASDTSRTLVIENCKVLNCWISDNNNANSACQRTSGIIAGNVGHNATTIKNCFASGNVTSSTEISGGIVGNTSIYCPSVSIQSCIVLGSSVYPIVNGSNQKINKHLDVAGTYSGVYTDMDSTFADNQVKKLAEADMKGSAAKSNMPDLDWGTWIAFEGELPDYRANHTLKLEQNDDATHNITCTDCGKAMAETHNFVENATGTIGECECGYSAPITDRRTDIWDGSYDSNFPAGTGTKADPYIVKTAEQMAYVALKSTAEESKGKYYKVAPNMVFNMNGMSGVTMNSTAAELQSATTAKDWVNDSNKFAGNFDGNGVVIYNISSSNGSSYGYAALFPRVISDNADITVTIKNITVLASRFKGYHYSAAIVGVAECTTAKQNIIVENCAVKNCFIGDNGNKNTACNRTAGTIIGSAGNNIATVNNCLSVNNMLAGTDISGGFIGNTGAYGSPSLIKNSVMIGNSPYPVLMPTAQGNKAVHDNAVNPKCFKNVYTDQAVNGYSTEQIKVLTLDQMSGVNTLQNMELDFGAYWFANGGLVELLVSHNIAGGTANPDDNYAGHTASCKVCGISSVSIINHVYDETYTCTVCKFTCDHKNSEYITEAEVQLDCVTPHHLKKECACGYEERTVYEEATGHKLTKIEQKAPGCDTTGNIEHWSCEDCKSLFLTDDIWASMDNAVSVDAVTIAATGEHTAMTDSNGKIVYGMDFNSHWTICSECGKTIKSDNHTIGYTPKDDKTHSVECTICLYGIIQSEDHVLGTDERCDKCSWACAHEGTLTFVAKADADCENDGALFDHYLCSNCNIRFKDEAATQSVAKSDVVIDKLGHTFVDADADGKPDVSYSKENHWYHCETCDKDIFEPHNFSTTSEDGSTGKCECGYEGAVSEKIVDDWDGSFDSNLIGDGTKNNPYIIKTAEQFAYVALEMPYSASADKYFRVAPCRVFNMNGKTGITLDSTAIQVRSAAINKEWENPNYTDNQTKTFAGHFDGNGVIVYNVYTKGAYGGLFPHVTTDNNNKSTSIKNVTVLASFMQGYHQSGGIAGIINATTTSQFFSIENCAVKNCYIGDNGDKNAATSRIAGAIIGNVTHNATTMENCFATENIVDGSVISGGLIGNSSEYALYVEINNSVILGTKAYPELQPTAGETTVKLSTQITAPTTYKNIYTDCDVFGYGKTQIRKLSIENMSGKNAIDNMSLDFDAYWFANEGIIDLFVCHNTTGSAEATDNYAGHTVYCKDCGIKGIAVAAHKYNEQYVCTICDFECDHKNDKYISEVLIEYDCITSKQTAIVCSCGYVVKTIEHIKAEGHKFEKFEAKDPTCAVAGNIEYYSCENCECIFLTDDVWATYDNAISEKDTQIQATGKHTLEEVDGKVVYSKDDESHWVNCTVCAAKLQRVEHVVAYTEQGTTHDGVCTVCGYGVVKGEAHAFSRDHDNCEDCKWICSHDGTVVEVKKSDPTCTTDGVKTAHYMCTVCDMRFTDADAKTQVAKSDVVLDKLGHEYIDFDENGTPVHAFTETHHWYNCKVCGKGDYAEHNISVDTENYEGTYKWCEDENGFGCNYSTFDYNVIDEELQVAVTAPTNAFTKDVITDIFKIKRDHLYYEKFVEIFAKNGIEMFDAYEISPSQELPVGVKATINMISPEMYGLKAALVYVDLETGKLELVNSTVEAISDPNSKTGSEVFLPLLTAKTGKLGYFAVVSALDVEGNDNIIQGGTDGDNSTISPPTGDNSVLLVTFMLILASATILFVRKAKI